MATTGGKTAVGVGGAAIIAAAVAFIQPWESPGGKPQLTPYRDIVGVWTACYGDTDIDPGKVYTVAECDHKIRVDVERRFTALYKCVNRELPSNQWVPLISLSYNAGTAGVCKSKIVKLIKSGAPASVWCDQLHRWVYAGGRRVKGLVNRREDEYRMCIGNG